MYQTMRFNLDRGWKLVIKDMGGSFHRILKTAGLSANMLEDSSLSLSIEEYFRLWNAFGEDVGGEDFPLLLGQNIPMESANPVILATYCSPNGAVCLNRLSQYKRLVGPMIFKVHEDETEISLEIECLERAIPLPPNLVAFELVFITNLIRKGTRELIVPQALTTTFPLHNRSYREYFGIPAHEGPSNRIVFSMKDAQRPFLTENELIWSFYEPELQKRLQEADRDASVAGRVRGALLEMLPSGICSIEDVSGRLGVSKRTLQRNLNKEATTFQKQLNHSREILARHYLVNTGMTSAEISFLIGYDDPNSFVRAFHLWTGTTPERVRKESRTG